MSNVLIVIPARYGSTRLKAKLLEEINGKSILELTWRAAIKSGAGDVLVATDSQIILDMCRAFGAAAVMTSENCQSGTDRVYEASKNRSEKFIINVQGDEPFIEPQTIKMVAELIKTDKETDIATACYPTLEQEKINNPNAVKAALAANNRAIYFSRSAVPFIRDGGDAPYYIHSGIYGYKKAALARFVKLPPGRLEKLEKLEQLRALEDGMLIKTILIKTPGPAIDTARDLEAARKYKQEKN